MEEFISGVIKDISFHQLFMKSLRVENIKSNLFDIQLAYYMLDSSKDTLVNAFEVQGFLDKHSYHHQECICQYIINCLDKSAIGLTFQKFANILIEGTEQQKLLACCRNNKPKLTSADYEYWDKIKADTILRTLNILNKQAVFYTKLEDRKRTFCKNWFGDVYKALNFFNQKDCLNYNDVYEFLKSRGILFNQNQWKALVSRTTNWTNNQYPKQIKKQELIDCLVTSKFKKKVGQSKVNSFEKGAKSYSKWLDEQYVLARKHRINSPKIEVQQQFPVISQLSYKYHYPEAQMHSASNLFILQQRNKQLVKDKLNQLDRDKKRFSASIHDRQYNLYHERSYNPFASTKYY